MLDKADIEDCMIAAQSAVDEIFAEAVKDYERPDKLLELAVMAQTMPDEAWELVDEETVESLKEVFNARNG